MSDSSKRTRDILSKLKSGELRAEEAFALLRTPPPSSSEARPARRLADRLETWLIGIVSTEARVPAARIDPRQPLEKYGFDSVMVVNVNRVLEKQYGRLSKTLLFEHQTVAELARHLADAHPDASARAVDASGDAGGDAGGVASSEEAAASARAAKPPAAQPARPAARAAAAADEPIAIVGLSGRFPMADDLDELWKNLEAGKDCITEVPNERWDHRRYFDAALAKPGKSYTKWGGFLRDVDKFDAGFFHITPREAERMDPQERLFLEEVWHSLEDAGVTRQRAWGRDVGVYVGVMYSQYQLLAAEESVKGNPLSLGSSYASIANRVSYFFNFQGPSMALDTMCSSSLTAIHLACEALRRGDIEMAIAGGVNVTIHPAKHVDLSQGRFASTDGRCRSFGSGGDGYVPGEGVGAAVLKRLSQAIADGDRIHAVIRGSALNHGGKTNGYTVPNPKAQSRVIAETLARAGVSPRHVSYVEAHGTGTSLGDPIEITGLASAFLPRSAEARQFCAIGSIKSNIGHLESAAGIAGLAKIVLQMRHGLLAPSLHANVLNPNIDLEESPFRVQRELAPWERPVVTENGVERRLPRIAGISSFGAGGANAHVVIEEWLDDAPSPARPASIQLVVLSARSEERLRAQARALGEHVKHLAASTHDPAALLEQIAYTLQLGREPLDEKVAFVVRDLAELVAQLQTFASGGLTEAIRGPSEDRAGMDVLEGDAGASFFDGLYASKDFGRVARLWVQGVSVEWERLHDAPLPRKLTLPGYPFARERHWPEAVAEPLLAAGSAALHPLVGRNTSTVDAQSFSTRLDGSEVFMRDHVVAGRPMLPGAAVVEMARAAAALSGIEGVSAIEDITFESPIALDGPPLDVTITLASAGDRWSFIASSEGDAGVRVVHARGHLATGGEPRRERVDLAALAARCPDRLRIEDCYDTFAQLGLAYGPGFRALERLDRGAGEALARVKAPSGPAHAGDAFVVHPAVLDGVLQSVIAFHARDAQANDLEVPVSIARVDLHSALREDCWVHARRTPGDGGAAFDFSVIGDDGSVLARIEGLRTARMSKASLLGRPAVRERGAADVVTAGKAPGTVVLRPVYESMPAADSPAAPLSRVLLLDVDGRLADLIRRRGVEVIEVRPGASFGEAQGVYTVSPAASGDYEELLASLAARAKLPDAILHAWSGRVRAASRASSLADDLETGIHAMLALVQGLMRRKAIAARIAYVHPISAGREEPAFAAIAALGKTLAAENPSYVLTCVGVETRKKGDPAWTEKDAAEVLDVVSTSPRGGEALRIGLTGRHVRRMEEVEPEALRAADAPFKRGGVYVITGGLGGLGTIFADHLAKRWRARLVLVGRSPLDARGSEVLRGLEARGGQAVYVQADCARTDDARRLVSEAKRTFGRIDGILHLAGTTRDSFILKKTRQETDAVLASKVNAALAIDEATRDELLDFFALFASATGVMGNVGQADYAYANAFLDHFAARREEARRAGERSGRTVSIDWPLWQGGGMDVDESAKAWIKDKLGWVPLEAELGTRLFGAALASSDPQWAVFVGDRAKILASLQLAGTRTTNDVAEREEPMRGDTAALEKSLVAHVRAIVAAEAKLSVDRLDPNEPFERIGLESVMIMNITRVLEKSFGELPKTLFFEHKTIREVARWLLGARPGQVAASLEPARPAKAPTAPVPSARRFASSAAAAPAAPKNARPAEERSHDEPIAIVGLAGRYPMAADVTELWKNLAGARDCIVEVPAERWDHKRHFDPSKSATGKAYSKWGGFLDDVTRFDALAFNISPREARLMSPQERLFLETTWATIEDAGYTRRALARSRVGVFVGVMYSEYQLYGTDPALRERGFVPAGLHAQIANRASFFFDFRGPSIALDTMCSSSLTALHLACQSIRSGECDAAIVGGVNTSIHPNKYLQLSQGKFASTDGRCRSFGEGGDGYVPGEGVGAVLLKPLSRALEDGDHVYAIVKATAVNHGGRSNGYTVPTPVAQGEVIEAALRRAGLTPADVGYVEAHGTGTSLGDPIEIAGLTRAFEAAGPAVAKQSCPIGSVKSNIGHLESAAGIAGVTKVILQMQHGMLAPSIHADALNPNIKFEDTPFKVQRERSAWPRLVSAGGIEKPRVGTVSSFGAGGANAHVVLEELLDTRSSAAPADGPEVVVLSARTDAQLVAYARALLARLRGANSTATPATTGPTVAPGEPAIGARQVAMLAAIAAAIIDVAPSEIDAAESFESLGLDPMALSLLAERASRELGVDVTMRVVSEAGTIRALAARVASMTPEKRAREAGAASDAAKSRHLAADISLADLAYTLQVGREAMDERLAIVVSDLAALEVALAGFVAGETTSDNIQRGRTTGESAPWRALLDGKEGAAYLRTVIEDQNLAKLARLWVSGVDVEWSLLPRATRPRRVSLPTYPFAGERYWVPAVESTGAATAQTASGRLAFDAAASLAEGGLVFRTTIAPDEDVVRHHVVGGHKVLPGVGHLALAHDAARAVLGADSHVRFSRVTWLRPLVVGDGRASVSVLVRRKDVGKTTFEIRSHEADASPTVHCRGEIGIADAVARAAPSLDERATCTRTVSKTEHYDRLAAVGLQYGRSFQTIQEVRANGRTAWATLDVPSGVSEQAHHHGVMDGALQAIASLSEDSGGALLPFSVERVDVLAPLPTRTYARVQASAEGEYAITLLDEAGKVCVRFDGLALRPLTPRKEERSGSVDLARVHRAFTAVDDLGTRMLVDALQEMGALREPGERRRRDRLAADLGVVAVHARLFDTLVDVLTTAGVIEPDGADHVRATAKVNDARSRSAEDARRETVQAYPEMEAHVELLCACLREYPRLLRGEVAPTEVVFPRSSMALVERIYKGNPLSDHNNRLVARAVRERITSRLASGARDQRVRILEVGAGTGGTSAGVFEAIRDLGDRIGYTYTDVSVGFLQHGKKRYGADNPYVEFKRLDIERDVREQGYLEGSYDLVVAANVLHATRTIRSTMRHVADLLADGGQLVLNETTGFSVFATLTFGLLDGWWRWEDGGDRIKGSPLLSVDCWSRVLRETGYATVDVLGDAGASAASGHAVLVARRERTASVAAPAPERAAAPASVRAGIAPAATAPPPETRAVASPGRAAPADAHKRALDTILDAMSAVLEIERSEFDVSALHSDFGVDSVLAVEIVERINTALGSDLKPTDFFNYSTIRKLADHLASEMPAAAAPAPASVRAPAPPSVRPPASVRPPPSVRAAARESGSEGGLPDVLRKLARGEITAEEADRLMEAAT